MAESPELLSERGLFAFDPYALEEIALGFGEISDFGAEVTPVIEELVHLTAAEFALGRLLPLRGALLPLGRPLQVEHRDAVAAFLKTNCNPVFCLTEITHRELEPTDLMAFGSDVSKLRWARADLAEPARTDAIGSLARVVDFLERQHREGPTTRGRDFAGTGILRLQGFLWAVKATLPEANMRESVAAAYDAFELAQPVGGVPA